MERSWGLAVGLAVFLLLVRYALAASALLVILMTALPLSRSSAWWVRMFDFPRMQITALALVVLMLYAVFGMWRAEPGLWNWVLAALLLTATIYQCVQMVKYTPLYSKQTLRADPAVVDPDRRLRLVVSNVLMQNREGERWLQTVRQADPDVIAAVETDQWWVDTASTLEDDYPHAVNVPKDDTYGMFIRSKLPIVSHETRHLVEAEVPSLLLTLELRSGETVTMLLLHPRPPRPDIQQDSDLRDAELVLAGRDVAEIDGPVVVAGDLNDVAWSHTTSLFQQLSGLLDPRVGRGMYSTFHAEHWWLRYPLDHVFHSEHFALVELRRLEAVGSDHFPMLIELEIDPAVEPLQRTPDAERDDQEEADEMIDEAQELKAEETEAERQERVEEDQ